MPGAHEHDHSKRVRHVVMECPDVISGCNDRIKSQDVMKIVCSMLIHGEDEMFEYEGCDAWMWYLDAWMTT